MRHDQDIELSLNTHPHKHKHQKKKRTKITTNFPFALGYFVSTHDYVDVDKTKSKNASVKVSQVVSLVSLVFLSSPCANKHCHRKQLDLLHSSQWKTTTTTKFVYGWIDIILDGSSVCALQQECGHRNLHL